MMDKRLADTAEREVRSRAEVWAMILAAGESKRMKSPKLLMSFGDKSIIEKVIENVTGSEVFNTLVVLGAYREEILGIIGRSPVTTCYNDSYKEGMLSSVRCGFQNLPQSCGAVCIFPGDQPMIGPEVTNKLLAAYRESDKGLIIPVFRTRRGHPLLVDMKYREKIFMIDHVGGLRNLAATYPDDVLEVPVGSTGILKDIDTIEDYLNEINQM